MRHVFVDVFVALLFAVMPGLAFAQPLTFEDALSRAETAPSVQARSLDVEARRSAAIAAGRLPDPRLGVGLDSFPVSGPSAFTYAGDGMTMARVGISQDVPNAAKRHAQQGRAQADVAAAEASGFAEARRVKVATALAWIDLYYAERRLAVIDAVIAQQNGLADAAHSGVASGSARPAQTLDVRQAIAALEDKRSEAAADAARARSALARWTGDANPEVTGTVPDFAINPTALREAVGQHPDLNAAMARTRQAEADVIAARATKRPDWSFDVAYQRRADRYGDMVSAGVTISLPLFAGKRQDPMIAASSASASAALAEQEDMRRALAADLQAGIADHVMHREQWVRSRDDLLPLARQKADLETASYSAGRAGLIDVIQAQTLLANTEIETLDREALVARDGARLVLTYGSDRQ